jgi:hypothetical protein
MKGRIELRIKKERRQNLQNAKNGTTIDNKEVKNTQTIGTSNVQPT